MKDTKDPGRFNREDAASQNDEAYKAFTKDKRKRISTGGTEKVEYRKRENNSYEEGSSAQPAERRSYNPNFTADNRFIGDRKPRGDYDPDRRAGYNNRGEGRDNNRNYGGSGEYRPRNNYSAEGRQQFNERRGDQEKREYQPRREYGEKREYQPRREYGEKREYNNRSEGHEGREGVGRSYGGSSSYGTEKREYQPRREYGERREYNNRPDGQERREGAGRSYGGSSSYGTEKREYQPRREYGEKREYQPRREYGEKREYNNRPDGQERREGTDRSYGGSSSYGTEKREYQPRREYGEKREYQPRREYGEKRGYQPRREYGAGARPSYGQNRGESRYGDRKPFRKPEGDSYKPKYNSENYPSFPAPPIEDKMRLNRYVAMSGICSRREADEFIQSGVVTVNDEVVTEMGAKVSAGDVIKFNGNVIINEKKVYIVMNKPKGFVTSVEDPHAEKTVMELLKNGCRERVYPVGRLDKSSLGVLLITNDGDLAKKLTHPSFEKKKVYQVTLDKPLTRADMDEIVKGITLDDGDISADAISYVGDKKTEVGIEIHSGRNRIVRRIFEHLGYRINKLDRVYFAGLTKQRLRRGEWRFLSPREVQALRSGRYE